MILIIVREKPIIPMNPRHQIVPIRTIITGRSTARFDRNPRKYIRRIINIARLIRIVKSLER